MLKSIFPCKFRQLVRKILNGISLFHYDYSYDRDLSSLTRKINLYYSIFPSKKKDYIDEIDFLNQRANVNNPFSFVFPYPFVFENNSQNCDVSYDEKRGLFYVIHNNKRLYYSKTYESEADVRYGYNCITIEQNKNSPHVYLSETFNVEKNDVIIDIGAAEGNFSLDVVERASELYITETDKDWIEALQATFEPWKDKVQIINKYASNINNENSVTIDSILGKKPVDFVKMDVEGAELSVLEGLKNIIANNKALKLAICTYHRKNDAATILEVLQKNKFDCSFSNGNMLFIYSRLSPPYFRRGLIRGIKQA